MWVRVHSGQSKLCGTKGSGHLSSNMSCALSEHTRRTRPAAWNQELQKLERPRVAHARCVVHTLYSFTHLPPLDNTQRIEMRQGLRMKTKFVI